MSTYRDNNTISNDNSTLTDNQTLPQNILKLSEDEIIKRISDIRNIIKEIDDTWRIIKTDYIEKIRNSWIAEEANAYIEKILNEDINIKNTIDSLELLIKAYEKILENNQIVAIDNNTTVLVDNQ